MIERHVTFQVYPDKTGDFVNLFRDEYRPAMSAMPGFVGVELLVEQTEPCRYQMVIRFESLEEAAAWRNSPQHQALSPRLKALYQDSQVQVYEVLA